VIEMNDLKGLPEAEMEKIRDFLNLGEARKHFWYYEMSTNDCVKIPIGTIMDWIHKSMQELLIDIPDKSTSGTSSGDTAVLVLKHYKKESMTIYIISRGHAYRIFLSDTEVLEFKLRLQEGKV
jgi:hypothetical protein